MVKRTPVPVIPVGLDGLWGSYYSHAGGPPFKKWPKRLRAKLTLAASEPIQPKDLNIEQLQERVSQLCGYR